MAAESKIFQELQELSRIVSIAGPKKSTTISLKVVEKSKSPYAELFRAIRDDSQITEQSIFQNHFARINEKHPQPGSGKTTNKKAVIIYRKVKSRLKRRLLDTLFVLNLNDAGYSQYSQDLFDTNRMVFLTRVLGVLGSKLLSVEIAKNG